MKDMKKHKSLHTLSEVDEKQEQIIFTTATVKKEETVMLTDLYCKECSLTFATKVEFVVNIY